MRLPWRKPKPCLCVDPSSEPISLYFLVLREMTGNAKWVLEAEARVRSERDRRTT